MNPLLVADLVVAVLAVALDGIGYAVTGIADPGVLLKLTEVRMATAGACLAQFPAGAV